MKIGSSCIDPLTGVHGFVVKFLGDQPIGRTADGQYFKARSPVGRPAQPRCLVRVIDDGEVLSAWLAADRLANSFRVVEADPVWQGAELPRETVEIQAAA